MPQRSWLNWGNLYQISGLVSHAKDKFRPKNEDANDGRYNCDLKK
jgi:hypothetical protein